ncbi:MAG: superoxide dismutase family protein [bacterium]
MRRISFLLAGAALLAFTMIGNAGQGDQGMVQGEMSMMPQFIRAVAVLSPTEGNAVHGTVTFVKVEGGVHVVAEVYGLQPGTKHGIHIHEYGDISAPDGTSTGGHFNPSGMKHGGPMAKERHAGDMGNLVVGDDGVGRVDYVDSVMKLNGSTSIIGRGVIVHAGEDDLVSQPTGAAGARVASGVIGIAAP